MDKITTEIFFGGGAGGAKSFLGCAWLIIVCGKYPETRWVMGRSKLKTLKETTLKTFFEVCKKWEIKSGVDFEYNKVDSVITWSNGSEILLKDLFLYPSDPDFDELGSLEITGAFVDEVSQVVFKAWEILRARCRYKLQEYGLIRKILGSCNPSKRWPYQEFYKPWAEGRLETGKAFIRALAKDNPFLPAEYIDNLKSIKDKATRERLLFGNWEYDDDPSCLLDYNVISDLFTTKVKNQENKYIIGDVARKGRDRAVIGYWEGLQLKTIYDLPFEIKKHTGRTALWIINLAEKRGVRRANILIDEDGVGGGVVDGIPGCKGFINNSPAVLSELEKKKKARGEFFNNYGNLKTQCAFKLAELAEKGEVGIEELNDVSVKELLIEDLEQIKQKDIDKDGKIYLVAKAVVKENIGRSPDFGDMLVMRMFYEIYKKPKPSIIIV